MITIFLHEIEILQSVDADYLANKVDYLVFEFHNYFPQWREKYNGLISYLSKNFDTIEKTNSLCFMKSKKIIKGE